jgi:hypothetical protein
MRSNTFIPRFSNAERSRLDAEARVTARQLREQAIRDGWSALERLATALVATMQRHRRAVSS